MESLSFQYPAWYFGLCILLGAIFAFTLYFRDKRFEENPTWLPITLSIVRFLAGTLISALLLSPLLKSIVTEQKDPIIVLANDNSSSLQASNSEEELATIEEGMDQLSTNLSTDFSVERLSFGDQVNTLEGLNYEEKITNLSRIFQFIFDTYANQNLGAVVIATDGIFNEGRNPLYANLNFTAPVHFVALGDTSIKKDLLIKQVFNNKIAYLGDKFSIQVDIQAKNCTGSKSNLVVSKVNNGNIERIKSEPIDVNSNDYFKTVEIILDADNSGINQYRISLDPVRGESSRANNTKDIFVEILDARQKILIYANSPHPDLSALQMGLGKNINYETEVVYAKDGVQNINQYDFVIFHNLPSSKYSITDVMTQINQRKTPRFFILGNQTNLGEFNQIQNALTITGTNNDNNPAQALIAENFSLFTISDNLINNLETFVPLLSPFGDYSLGANTETLLYQKIGKIDTKYPLLVYNQTNEIKTGILAGEGLWRWRLFDFMEDSDHEIFSEVLSKSIQYVSLKDDKRKFRVNTNAKVYRENEKILFTAELYNDSYEMVNDPEVFLTIKNAKGEDFNFTFSRFNNYYRLDASLFPPGSYNFTARVNYNGNQMEANGRFNVRRIQLELYDLQARHGLLRNISNKYGGQVFYPDQMESLTETILESDEIKPVIYQNSKTRSVINLKWIFGILLFLLSLEWFLRRYFGTY